MTSAMIWQGTIALGAIGLVLGIFISVVTQFFHVEENPLVEKIQSVLPQFNCGACGYPGCRGYAEALGNRYEKSHLKCKPGKDTVAQKILDLIKD